MTRYADDTEYLMVEIYKLENRFIASRYRPSKEMAKSELRRQTQEALLNTAKRRRRRRKPEAVERVVASINRRNSLLADELKSCIVLSGI